LKNNNNNNNCACSKRAQLEWEAAEEARLLAERKARKKAKKEEKKRANFKERAQLLGVKIITHQTKKYIHTYIYTYVAYNI
jgi:hypothetical protein